MRWRMSRGVPKVRESMSSVEMPYTWRREGGKGRGLGGGCEHGRRREEGLGGDSHGGAEPEIYPPPQATLLDSPSTAKW